MSIAATGALCVIRGPVRERRADAERKGVAHGDIDVLTLAGLPPVADSQQERREGGQRTDGVAVAEAGLRGRVVIQVAIEGEEAAGQLHGRAEGHGVALGQGLAVAGER